ncbi:UNVERIFIED_CONTAM: hypothetical protein K2H54_062082, partial [Gekko kuhli]
MEEFPDKLTLPQIKEEDDERLAQPWETRWQDLPKELQSFHTGWGNPRITEPSPWDQAGPFPPPLEGAANSSHQPTGERLAQLSSGLETDGRVFAKDEA